MNLGLNSTRHIDKDLYYYDADEAEKIIYFFEEELVHVRGEKAGEPFLLEEFQKYHLRQVFGWFDKRTKKRKHRFFYLEIPKGNGKSPVGAGIALFMNCAESVIRGETYCVAGDRFQARIVFDGCSQMINDNPRLSGGFETYKNSIIHKKTQSVIHVISAESAGKHGFRPYCIVFDELHVQPNRDLYDTLTKGLIKMTNTLCAMLTTAGLKFTFADDVATMARSIAHGIIKNDFWYVAVYEAPDEALEKKQYFTEKTIKSCNPGYGTILKPDNFALVVEDTKSQPSSLNSYLRLHLNKWTSGLFSWVPAGDFALCNLRSIDLEKHAINQVECYGGLDMASTADLCAYSLIFVKGDDILDWQCWFWCPMDAIESREKNENVNYSLWMDQGFIFGTPGNVQDHELISEFIIESCEKYNVQSIQFDPALFKTTAAKLADSHEIPLVEFSQNMGNFSEPTKEFEKAIKNKMKNEPGIKTINHAGNPVLAWQMSNTYVFRDSNDRMRPVKNAGRGKNQGQTRNKIDGIVSGIMAFAGWMESEIDKKGSIYEERGVRTV